MMEAATRVGRLDRPYQPQGGSAFLPRALQALVPLPPEARSALLRRLPPGTVIGSIRQLKRPLLCQDASYKYIVHDAHDRPIAFLDWSSPMTPASTQVACDAAEHFRRAVGEGLDAVAAAPVDLGAFEGRRCSVLPVLFEAREERGARLMQRALTARRLMSWLQDVAARTSRLATAEEVHTLYGAPLHWMVNNGPGVTRELSRHARAHLLAQRRSPRVHAAHYDLHRGNVMYESSHWWAAPRIIDWGAARAVGHPHVDMLCLGSSLRIPAPLLRAYLRRHLRAHGEAEEDLACNLMASLGFVRLAHPNMADDLFSQLVANVMDWLKVMGVDNRPSTSSPPVRSRPRETHAWPMSISPGFADTRL